MTFEGVIKETNDPSSCERLTTMTTMDGGGREGGRFFRIRDLTSRFLLARWVIGGWVLVGDGTSGEGGG